MPEKSRERRIQIARRQGKATAIKSSDVGLAKGLSKHAAKKSSHVEGMRTQVGRSVGRKAQPGEGRLKTEDWAGATIPGKREPDVRGSVQRTLSRRSQSAVAAKSSRRR